MARRTKLNPFLMLPPVMRLLLGVAFVSVIATVLRIAVPLLAR